MRPKKESEQPGQKVVVVIVGEQGERGQGYHHHHQETGLCIDEDDCPHWSAGSTIQEREGVVNQEAKSKSS